jgi:molecular chaperone Hsp33
VELVSGEIGADLAHYLHQSEQTRSAVLLGVLAKPEGIAGAGGIIVEALPGVSGTVLAAIERNLAAAEAVSRLVEAGGLAGLLDVVLAGLDREVVERRGLRYHCRCRRERLQQHLAVVAPEELASLQGEDGAIEAECAFCGVLYRFAPSELDAGSAIH